MKVWRIYVAMSLVLVLDATASVVSVPLGTAGWFSVLAGDSISNTGSSIVDGDIGVWPGTDMSGVPPVVVVAPGIVVDDAVAMQAQKDLTTAYNAAAGEVCDVSLTGQDLGGLTLMPGVYCFTSSAQLTGTLTLDAQDDSNAVFVFQIVSTLTTASNSGVVLTNHGQGNNVFWQVGSSATLGTSTAFSGNILALTSITLNTDAGITCGSALARNGAVTMDTNNITTGCASTGGTGTPEPGSALLSALGIFFTLGICRWRGRRVS